MRKFDAAALAASKKPAPAAEREQAAVRLVCMALTLALVTLASRIFGVW